MKHLPMVCYRFSFLAVLCGVANESPTMRLPIVWVEVVMYAPLQC